jgi:hypothetical protein
MPKHALADHYLKSAGIAAIEIGADGEVSVRETVDTKQMDGICYCCVARDIDRLAALARRCRGDQAAVAMQIEQLGADHYIGVTHHAVVVDRAMAAVDAVHDMMQRMQGSGGMKQVNEAFKAARATTPSLRYRDHLEAFKLKLIEAMAAQISA